MQLLFPGQELLFNECQLRFIEPVTLYCRQLQKRRHNQSEKQRVESLCPEAGREQKNQVTVRRGEDVQTVMTAQHQP